MPIMIAEKRERHIRMLLLVRTRIRFALIKSTHISIRGLKGRVNHKEEPVDEIDSNIIPTTMCVAI